MANIFANILPVDILKLIASFLVQPEYRLIDWISHDSLNYFYLSKNPCAVHILKHNLDKINWKILSRNPDAKEIFKQNLNKVNWTFLSENPNAIHILKENLDKIDWRQMSFNPSIFEIDKTTTTTNINNFALLLCENI